MWSVLLLGFLIGMQHSLEADHIAAVATLAAQSSSAGRTLGLGAAWGVGHAVPLFFLGALLLLTNVMLPAGIGRWLDVGVGLMLVGLGGDVLRKLARQRLHFHVHRHDDGKTHVHFHSHAGESTHNPSHHRHQHGRALSVRALLVGMVHGLAGSGALVLLTVESIHSPGLGMAYIALFALGTLAGMVLLSTAVSLPLAFVSQRLDLLHGALQAVVGAGTLTLGLSMVQSVLRS